MLVFEQVRPICSSLFRHWLESPLHFRACASAMCERKFLCSGFLSEIQCQRFFRICGGPLTGTVYLWLASSICGGLVCFRVQCTYNTQQTKTCHVHAHWICHIAACACSLLLTHAQFYTLFWTNKSHTSTLFFNISPPTHMFFNLRPVANFGPVLPAVLKFYAVRL